MLMADKIITQYLVELDLLHGSAIIWHTTYITQKQIHHEEVNVREVHLYIRNILQKKPMQRYCSASHLRLLRKELDTVDAH